MERKTKKDVVSEFRHSALLDAARHVFGRRGFADASVDEIARRAGVAKGTVYLYYRSKRALYWASLREGLVALSDEIRGKVEEGVSLRDKIEAFVATKVSYFEAHRDFVQIYYAELSNAAANPCVSRRDFKDISLKQVRILKDAVHGAVKRREIPPVAEEPAAYAILDLTRGVITRRLMGSSGARPEKEIDFVVDVAWKAFGPR